MKTLFVLALGIIIGAAAVWLWRGRKECPVDPQVAEKEARKKRILEEISRNGKITNDEAQKLLGVSDATAERYLNELEKEGKIRQVGRTGAKVYYEILS